MVRLVYSSRLHGWKGGHKTWQHNLMLRVLLRASFMLTPKFKEDCITWLELSQIIELSARNWWNESEHATNLTNYRKTVLRIRKISDSLRKCCHLWIWMDGNTKRSFQSENDKKSVLQLKAIFMTICPFKVFMLYGFENPIKMSHHVSFSPRPDLPQYGHTLCCSKPIKHHADTILEKFD